MFCKNCGKQLPDDAKFCGNCGTPVTAPAAPWTPAPAPAAAPDGADKPVTGAMEETPAETAAPEETPVEAAPAEAEQPAAEAPAETPEMTRAGDKGPAPEEAPIESAPEAAENPAANQGPAPESRPEAAPAGMPRFDTPRAEPQAQGGSGAATAKKNKAISAVIGLGGAALIALVAAAIWMAVTLLGGGGKAGCVYLNDDGELMYLPSLKENAEAVEITDKADYSANVQFSQDGKTVYFMDADGTLYQADTAGLKKDGEKPDRIARNVISYQVLDGGRVLYAEGNDSDEYTTYNYKVSLYEDGQSSRLAKRCGDWAVSGDGKTLYYEEQDEDGGNALYKTALSRDGKEEKLLDGYDVLYTAYDSETLVYSVRSEGKVDEETGRTDGNTLTVYSAKPGEKGTKLVSDVYAVLDVTAEGGKASFYYTKESLEKRSLYDFVTDNSAAEDAELLQEEGPEYPDRYYEYSPEDFYVEGSQAHYTTASGVTYAVDIREFFLDVYGGYEEYDIADIHAVLENWTWGYGEGPIWDDVNARYEAAENAYYEWYEKWEAAQNREYAREALKGERQDQASYTLLRCTGEKDGETVAAGLKSSYPSQAENIFVYQKATATNVRKVADLAELETDYYSDSVVYQVRDLLNSGEDSSSSGSQWYQNVGGRESELDLDEEDYLYGLYQVSDKEVVLHLYDGDEERLDSYAIGADGLTLSDTIYEGELNVAGLTGEPGGKTALYLFTETETDGNYNTLGDFCVYRDGKLETIIKEIYWAAILEGSGDTYVVTDVDDEYNTELALLQDGKAVTIADEVSDRIFLEGGQLLYVSDSDLYLWNGKESQRLARDVEYVWSSGEEGYRGFHPGY